MPRGKLHLLVACMLSYNVCTDTSATRGLPNARGSYCFLSAADCEKATGTTGECIKDSATCATGQAGPTQYVYIHTSDQPSVASGVPNGAGISCFGSQADCEASNNNPCGTPPAPLRCSTDLAACATGPAGPLPATFTCRASYPVGSLPSGSGMLCYNSYDDCIGGPNACGNDIACAIDPSVCSTGMAGPSSHKYVLATRHACALSLACHVSAAVGYCLSAQIRLPEGRAAGQSPERRRAALLQLCRRLRERPELLRELDDVRH
jgi:hypothetical protein